MLAITANLIFVFPGTSSSTFMYACKLLHCPEERFCWHVMWVYTLYTTHWHTGQFISSPATWNWGHM